MEIEKKLLNDIEAYCKLNEIENPSKFATDLLRNAFNVEKYGERPFVGKPLFTVYKMEEKTATPPPEEEKNQDCATPQLKTEENNEQTAPKKKRGRPKKEETVVKDIPPKKTKEVIEITTSEIEREVKPKKRKLS